MESNMPPSRELELLVARIQQQLAPTSQVHHDVKLPGRRSGRSRQIDVLVRQQVGQYDIKIIIDCKDYARPVDVKGVEAFYGLLDDVGAQKGVLVCPKGFSSSAKRRADEFLIDLFSPVDTGSHKWKANVSIPAVCDFREAAMSFGLRCKAPYPFKMPMDFYSSVLAHDHNQQVLGFPLERAMVKWNAGEFPTAVGEHQNESIFDIPEVFIDNGYGMQVPVALTVDLYVERRLLFGHFPITKISGFKDEIRGGLITNAFTVHLLDPDQIMAEWEPIESEAKAPIRPTISLTGLVGWVAD